MQLCRLDKTKMCIVGQQNGDICSSSPKIFCRQNPLFREVSLFLLRLSTDWMWSIHIMESNSFHSKFVNLNVNLTF